MKQVKNELMCIVWVFQWIGSKWETFFYTQILFQRFNFSERNRRVALNTHTHINFPQFSRLNILLSPNKKKNEEKSGAKIIYPVRIEIYVSLIHSFSFSIHKLTHTHTCFGSCTYVEVCKTRKKQCKVERRKKLGEFYTFSAIHPLN